MPFLLKLKKSLQNIFITLITIVAIWEVGYKFITPSDLYSRNNRYMLFGDIEGNSVFILRRS
jgi:hypothetical protein